MPTHAEPSDGRIKVLMHRIVARPAVYDALQTVAGVAYSDRRVRKAMARSIPLNPESTVVDVGGGTGRARTLWPESVKYVLIDNDEEKIEGFRRKGFSGEAICADATALPFETATVAVAIVSAVTHHLPPGVPEPVLAELHRVLKPNGRLLLLDAVWRPWRPVGRLLWHFDRGSYPRTAEELRRLLDDRFEIVSWETFSVFHRYILAVGRPRA